MNKKIKRTGIIYEHHKEPLISTGAFLWRLLRHSGTAIAIIIGSLIIGTIGYHAFEGLPWIDSLLNASMLLGGMGPVDKLQTNAGKLFASFYALYSGLVVLVTAGVMFAPVFHRFMHHFHLEDDEDD